MQQMELIFYILFLKEAKSLNPTLTRVSFL